jgi:hypothetical protein
MMQSGIVAIIATSETLSWNMFPDLREAIRQSIK